MFSERASCTDWVILIYGLLSNISPPAGHAVRQQTCLRGLRVLLRRTHVAFLMFCFIDSILELRISGVL